MSGEKKNELVAVYIDIEGDKRKMFEDIADTVLRRVLEEDEAEEAAALEASRAPPAPSVTQLLSASLSHPPLAAPLALNPLQLALCQSLAHSFQLPVFPLFVPPPQPTVESVELLRIFQNILAKQKK